MNFEKKKFEIDDRSQAKDSAQITVDIDQPSFYHAPNMQTINGKLYRHRLRLGYQLYRRLLSRYASLTSNSVSWIIDIGCGPGILLGVLEEWYPKTRRFGFDFDFRLLLDAKDQLTRTQLLQGNAERLPVETGKFDVVLSLHLVEHLFDPEFLVDEALRILRPKGIFIVATPNSGGIGARIMRGQWIGWRSDHVSLGVPDQWASMFYNKGFSPLHEGTTFLTGIPAFQKLPLALLNWGILYVFGTLPWKFGEAYISVWQKHE